MFGVIEVGSTNTKGYIYDNDNIIEIPMCFIEFKNNYKKENKIIDSDKEKLYEYINKIKNETKDIHVYGVNDPKLMTSTISINSDKINNSELSYILDSEYGIMTRTGLHCAPLAHKTIGTFPRGTLRFSFGYFNDTKDIDYILYCLNNILERK
jgi:selenocysteine lyase/cysteine desulfurase